MHGNKAVGYQAVTAGTGGSYQGPGHPMTNPESSRLETKWGDTEDENTGVVHGKSRLTKSGLPQGTAGAYQK